MVIVSALQRMRLYTQEYGLTELRLYTTAFMLWIAAGGVWYLATVLGTTASGSCSARWWPDWWSRRASTRSTPTT